MTSALRAFFKGGFIFLNIITVIFFLIASVAAYINPGKFWLIGILGVGFVFFLTAVIAFLIFWLILRSKWAWLSFVALIICWSQIYAVFGLNFFSGFNNNKPAGALRIMQWNVTSWNESFKGKKGTPTYRKDMFNYIAEQKPDVLCFQEFFESKVPRRYDPNIAYIVNELHYPYYYFVPDMGWWKGGLLFGEAIFSKYPIVDSTRKRYQSFNGREGESLIRVTLDVNGQKINIFTTHLQSFLFKYQDYHNIEILKRPEDNKSKVLDAGKSILYKFRNAYRGRYLQAELVRKELDKSHYPTIITGDFNDVPNSYTYFTIKGDYQDAFVKKGHGLGRTFHSISPTLRIDYILADKNFEVLQYKRDQRPWSDHYPVISDIMIKDPKSQ